MVFRVPDCSTERVMKPFKEIGDLGRNLSVEERS